MAGNLYEDLLDAEPQGQVDPAANPYDGLIEQEDTDKDAQVSSFFEAGLRTEPNRQADVISIARKTGMATDTVDANYDEFRRSAQASEFNARKWREENPKLAALVLERPELATVTFADKAMSFLGRATEYVGNALDVLSADHEQTRANIAADDALFATAPTREEWEAKRSKPVEAFSLERLAPKPVPTTYQVSPLAKSQGLARFVQVPIDAFKRDRMGAEMADLGFKALLARGRGEDDTPFLFKATDLSNQMAPQFYGNENAQPLEDLRIDIAHAAASQATSFQGLGAGAGIGAAVGGVIGAVTTRSAAGAREGAKAGAKLFAPLGMAAASFRQETGGAYLDFREAKLPDGTPITTEAAAGMAVAYGLVSSGIETLSLGPLAKGYAPLKEAIARGGAKQFLKGMLADRTFLSLASQAGKAWLKSAAAEGGEEVAQSVAQDLFKYAAGKVTAGQYGGAVAAPEFDGQGALVRGAEQFGPGFFGGALFGAGTAVAPVVSGLLARDRAAEAGARVALINEAVKNSPTAKAAPEAVAKLIEQETAESGETVTSLYVDPGAFMKLFQENGSDPNQAATELLGEDGPIALAQAQVTGGKLEVPLGDYLEKWGGKPIADALQQHTTTRPYRETLAELRAQEAQTEAQAREIAQGYAAENGLTTEEAERRLVDDVQRELSSATGASAGDAGTAVSPIRAFIRTQAARFGKSADELFADYAIRVTTQAELEREQAREQAAARPQGITPSTEQATESTEEPGPSGLEEARQVIASMRSPRRKAQALAWFDYTQGLSEERPKVDRELELELARYGVVDPQGFEYGLETRGVVGPRGQVRGVEPEEFRRARLERGMTPEQWMASNGRYNQEATLPAATMELAQQFRAMPREARVRKTYLDPLTGLLNKRGFEGLEDSARPLVAQVSLEGIKYLNDTYGHLAADGAYRAAARALATVAPDAAKVGGDFALRVRDQAELDRALEAIRSAPELQGLEVTGAIGEDLEAAAAANLAGKTAAEEAGARAPRGTRPRGLAEGEDVGARPFTEDGAGVNVPGQLDEAFGALSEEEAFNQVYTEESGLLTREGFFSLPRKAVQVSLDLNGVGFANRMAGTPMGDALIGAFSAIAVELGGERFDMAHLSGDEYALQGDSREEVEAFLTQLYEEVGQASIEDVEIGDTLFSYRDIRFGRGIGETFEDADKDLNADKQRLKDAGLRGDDAEARRLNQRPRGEGEQRGDSSSDEVEAEAARPADSGQQRDRPLSGRARRQGLPRAQGNAKREDGDGQGVEQTLFQSKRQPPPEAEPALLVQHNLTAENLLHAKELGGLPAPSLAVAGKDAPLTSFGEITLIAPPAMVDPEAGVPVFASDVYSPRHPRAFFKVNSKAALKLREMLRPYVARVDGYIEDLEGEIEREGAANAAASQRIAYPLKLAWLEQVKGEKLEGKKVPVKVQVPLLSDADALNTFFREQGFNEQFQAGDAYHRAMSDAARAAALEYGQRVADATGEPEDAAEYASDATRSLFGDDGLVAMGRADRLIREGRKVGTETDDSSSLREVVDERVKALGEDEFQAWAREQIRPAQGGAFIRRGSRRIPYTLENVLKELTGKIRAGEDFNYGLGTARAAGTKKFRSLDDIRKARSKVVSKEAFEEVKKEMDERFSVLTEKLSAYGGGGAFRVMGNLAEAIGESYKRGRSVGSELRKSLFEAVPEDVVAEVATFARDLLAMPTEYFEAKPQRAVDFGEFTAAVVPEGTKEAALEVLRASGVQVFTYPKGDDKARQEAVAHAATVTGVLFQGNDIDPRGYVQLARDGLRRLQATIVLNEKTDRSTFLHESGHIFLEMMGDLAERPDAPERLKDDYAKLLEWVGAKDRAAIGREQHEQFARGWEAYLLEGKSPSAALTRAFRRFQLWLKQLYRSARSLNVELSPEISGIFDRLLATDVELERAKQATGLQPLFRSPDEAGMTPTEWQSYLSAQEKATAGAARRAEQRMVHDKLRETEAWWKQEEEGLYRKALEEFDQRPDARAARYIKTGEVPGQSEDQEPDRNEGRLDRKKVYDLIGEDLAKDAFGWRLLLTGGVDPDSLPGLFPEFQTGRDALLAVVNLPDRKEWANTRAYSQMLERHEDIAQERDQLRELLEEGLHEESTASWLLWEWKALRKKGGQGVPPLESIKTAARLIAERSKVGKLNVGGTLNAERSAAQKAAVAAAKGDFAQAAVFKQQQLLNHYLYRSLSEAKEDRERFEDFAKQAGKDRQRGRLGLADPTLLGASDAIFEALGLRQPAEGEQWADPASLEGALRRLELDAMAVGFDADAVRALLQTPRDYRDLTVAELRNVAGALAQLRKAGMDASLVRMEGKAVELETLVAEVDAEASRLPKQKPRPLTDTTVGGRQMLGQFISGVTAALRDPEDLISRLGKTAHRFLWDGYLDARAREEELARTVLEYFDKQWEALPEDMQRRRFELVDTSSLPIAPDVNVDTPLDRQGMWMVALNMGNESNRERLLGGYGWDAVAVETFLNKNMTAEEWRFVQSTWDMLDKELYPHVERAYEAVNGIKPKKIPATPIRTPHGTFSGGYFPAKYRGDVTRIGARQDESAIQKLYSDNSVAASVAKGFTKARVENFSDVIDLNWSVVPGHVSQVIHYSTHDSFVRDAARLMFSPSFGLTLQQRLGVDYQTQLESWLKVVANGQAASNAQEMTRVYQALHFLKSRFVVSAIGLSLKSAMGNFANPLVTMGSGELSWRHGTASYLSVLVRYPSMRRDALAKSRELRNRQQSYAQKLKRQLAEPGHRSARTKVGRFLEEVREFGGIFEETADALTATAVWEGGYREALSKGKEDAAAVKSADALVRRNFPSKNLAEQPALLRDKRTIGAVVSFYSYFSKLLQVNARIGDRLLEGRLEGKPVASAARAAAEFLAVSFFAFGVSEALSGNGPEEGEEVPEWLLRKAITSPWAMLPIVGFAGEAAGNEAARFITGKGERQQLNVRAFPAAAGAERLYKQAKKIFDEDKETAERALAAMDVTLTAFQVPGAGQLTRSTNYVLKAADGDAPAENPFDVVSGLIYGPPRN